jgi:small subunit ribosomal protein S14
MAKTSKVVKNQQRIKCVQKFAARRAELYSIIKNGKTTDEEKDEARAKLRALPRDSSPIRIRNRCELTGRPRAYYRKFGLCRLELRKKALSGELPGVTKASW